MLVVSGLGSLDLDFFFEDFSGVVAGAAAGVEAGVEEDAEGRSAGAEASAEFARSARLLASSSSASMKFCSATQARKAFWAVSPSSVFVSVEKLTDLRR